MATPFKNLRQAMEARKNKVDTIYPFIAGERPRDYHRILHTLAMRNPWRPMRKGWANVTDQVGHAVYAASILTPVVVWPSIWTFMFSGFLLGVIRETEQFFGQDLKIRMIGDRVLDISSFIAGAALLYIVALG